MDHDEVARGELLRFAEDKAARARERHTELVRRRDGLERALKSAKTAAKDAGKDVERWQKIADGYAKDA